MFFISTTMVGTPVYASSGPAVVSAPIIVDRSKRPGSTFSINITIANVTEMWGYEFILSYDTRVLTATGYSSYEPFSFAWPSEINDTAGYVAVAYSMMMSESVGFSTVDPTPIVRIDFTVDTLGTSLLDLAADTESSLYEGRYHLHTILTDIMGEPITHDTVDGDFNNIGEDRDTFVTHVTLNVTPFLTWIVAVIVIIFFKVSSI